MKKQRTIFDCFTSERRVRLIACLSRPKHVNELLQLCDLSQPALSQHLKVLKEAGVLSCAREGTKQIYSVKNKKALSVARTLLTITK
jgi:DNA-binding transcriptional ArsR family regulator